MMDGAKIRSERKTYDAGLKEARRLANREGRPFYLDWSVYRDRWVVWQFGDRDDISVQTLFGNRYMETLVEPTKRKSNPRVELYDAQNDRVVWQGTLDEFIGDGSVFTPEEVKHLRMLESCPKIKGAYLNGEGLMVLRRANPSNKDAVAFAIAGVDEHLVVMEGIAARVDNPKGRSRSVNPCKRGEILIDRKRYKRKGYRRSDGTYVRPTVVPAASFCVPDPGRKGRRARGAEKGPYRKKAPWIEDTGSLGGPGYTKKKAATRRRLLDRCVRDEDYRSCLGKLQVLLRSTELKASTRKVLESDKAWLMKKYGGPGSFGPQKNPPRPTRHEWDPFGTIASSYPDPKIGKKKFVKESSFWYLSCEDLEYDRGDPDEYLLRAKQEAEEIITAYDLDDERADRVRQIFEDEMEECISRPWYGFRSEHIAEQLYDIVTAQQNPYQGDAVELAKYRKKREEWEKKGRKGPPPVRPSATRETRRAARNPRAKLNEQWVKSKKPLTVEDEYTARKYAKARAKHHGAPQDIYVNRRSFMYTVTPSDSKYDTAQMQYVKTVPATNPKRKRRGGKFFPEERDLLIDALLYDEEGAMPISPGQHGEAATLEGMGFVEYDEEAEKVWLTDEGYRKALALAKKHGASRTDNPRQRRLASRLSNP